MDVQYKEIVAECESWKSLLALMMDENAQLKNRVCEALQKGFEKKNIDEVENFQNEFLKEDLLIALLRNEVAELDRFLFTRSNDEREEEERVAKKIQRIRDDIDAGQQQLEALKLAFSEYLGTLQSG